MSSKRNGLVIPDPLIEALVVAERKADRTAQCKVCDYLRECGEPRATAIRRAYSQGVGFRKLAEVFEANDVAIGWRAVKSHRDKGHT